MGLVATPRLQLSREDEREHNTIHALSWWSTRPLGTGLNFLFARAVARTFKIIDPQTKHPATEQWERAFQNLRLVAVDRSCLVDEVWNIIWKSSY